MQSLLAIILCYVTHFGNNEYYDKGYVRAYQSSRLAERPHFYDATLRILIQSGPIIMIDRLRLDTRAVFVEGTYFTFIFLYNDNFSHRIITPDKTVLSTSLA